MKTLLVIFLCSQILVFGQTENPSYAGVMLDFQQAYNNSNYGAIFEMFDENMKRSLPLEKAKGLFDTSIKNTMGVILETRFLEFRNGAHVYRTRFSKAVADILLSLNTANEINGLYVLPADLSEAEILERNRTAMKLPFVGEWFVFWGGETLEQNYHVIEESQRYAYDMMKLVNDKSYEGDPLNLNDYFAFGEDILAPCNATVAKVITGVQDNTPGETNPMQLTGNTIVLESGSNEYLLFAHLKEGSIVVEKGEQVVTGQKIGECGNSGNSSEPHLHISLQNTKDMSKATGAKLFFDEIFVNGERKQEIMPVKNDMVKNID